MCDFEAVNINDYIRMLFLVSLPGEKETKMLPFSILSV